MPAGEDVTRACDLFDFFEFSIDREIRESNNMQEEKEDGQHHHHHHTLFILLPLIHLIISSQVSE